MLGLCGTLRGNALRTETELRLFMSGDPKYFAHLFAQITPQLRRKAEVLVSDPDAIDDVVQETWIRAHATREQFANTGSLEGWIWSICRNLCLDWARAENIRCARLARLSGLTEVSPPCHDARSCEEEGRRVEASVKWIEDRIVGLPSLQLRVAALRWLLAHSTAETARELGISPGTVKASLYQARQNIRARLSELDQLRGTEPHSDE